MLSEDKSVERRASLSKEERRRRSASPESEEEELDEFGRVKRRREKFKNERSEDGEYDDGHRSDSDGRRREDRHYSNRRHRRRRSSSSNSRSPPRRSYRRYSDSDSDYERNSSKRRRSHHRSYHSSSHQSHHREGGDLYSEAAQYIDTEFYATKVYIGDLENVTESQIESAFSRFGKLEDVRLVEGKDYGFLTFEKKEDALVAIQSMHRALLGSKHIKVNRAKIPERNKVGFGNIPWQDQDGLMAKEASSSSYDYHRRRSSTFMKMDDPHGYPPIQATIPAGRVLTSYDDL